LTDRRDQVDACSVAFNRLVAAMRRGVCTRRSRPARAPGCFGQFAPFSRYRHRQDRWGRAEGPRPNQVRAGHQRPDRPDARPHCVRQAARRRRRGDRIGHHNRAEGVLVARAISSPTFSTKIGVSNGAISLQYIHSRTDLSVLITFSGKRLFSVSF
jgi:hypothetical protein